MKFKKIDKEYQLSDSTVNCYGFRLLTTGYQLSSYSCNPVGYYMHGTAEHPREQGVVVRWEDLRVDGDQIFGKPVINLSHPRGERTVEEVENGFLSAASMGHFVVQELSDDPALKLPGQTGPTVTKWFNRECSLVDIPGNFNALKLFDKDENEINLADFSKPFLQNMKTITLSAEQLAKLNLNAASDATAINTVIDNLAAEAAKVPGLQAQLIVADSAKLKAENDLQNLKAESGKKLITETLAIGLAAGKYTKEVGELLAAQYAGKADEFKALVDKMPAYKSITTAINTNSNQVNDLAAKSWDELDRIAGSLENLKATNLELFKDKFKARFGKDYKD